MQSALHASVESHFKQYNNIYVALILCTHVIQRLTNGIMIMCITYGFTDGLGNNGSTNSIISSCLKISSTHNPFSSRFPFPVAVHHCNFYRVSSLHNLLPLFHLVTMHVCRTVGIYLNISYLYSNSRMPMHRFFENTLVVL